MTSGFDGRISDSKLDGSLKRSVLDKDGDKRGCLKRGKKSEKASHHDILQTQQPHFLCLPDVGDSGKGISIFSETLPNPSDFHVTIEALRSHLDGQNGCIAC